LVAGDCALMAGKVKIKRGDAWAERLQAHLEAHTEGAADWMQTYTHILMNNDTSVSGLLSIDDQLAHIKLYRFKSFSQKAKAVLGMAQPLRNFAVAGKLIDSGVPVPQPLACLKVGQGMLVMTQGLSGGGNLADLWLEQAVNAGALNQTVVHAAGETLAQLHTSGYLYGDCRWDNLFWTGQRVYLTHLDNVRKRASGDKLQARDLAQFTANAEWFGVSPALFEPFLQGYLQGVTGDRREIVERMMPIMYRLRAQHLSGYGQRLV
jgi:tRNA A-37 threonylcarbamoyl transferase component Bud32